VRTALDDVPRAVVAVSGGRDSMVLLEAIIRVAPGKIASVATFDHRTGEASTRAAQFVTSYAACARLDVRAGESTAPASTEAAWRSQRLAFLRQVAAELDARIITAHTLDDHLETVLMRVLRGAGARGLAGLLAPSDIVRPLVTVARAIVADSARAWTVPFLEDPSNLSRAHFRNRVRLDLFPALVSARPGLPAELLALSRRAAALRREVDQLIDEQLAPERSPDALSIARDDLARLAPSGLALVWPALAARQGVTLDRRGTERLASFTINAGTGARMQLSGGVEVLRHRDRLLLRRVTTHTGTRDGVPLEPGTVWGSWRFERTAERTRDLWSARLPADVPLRVRAWRAGDRMIPERSAVPRRLKGLFRDAGVDAVRRRQWPVVLAGAEIVWVPGVRRAHAASERSGRPNVTLRCEHIDR
jgi:tRNA(Ile)-lysidine synthase